MGRDYYWMFELKSKSFLRVAEKGQDLLDSVIVENTKKERENNRLHSCSASFINTYNKLLLFIIYRAILPRWNNYDFTRSLLTTNVIQRSQSHELNS